MPLTPPGGRKSRILSTYKFLQDSDQLMLSLARKYGDAYIMRLVFGDMLMFTKPNEIRQIFSLPPSATHTFASNVLQPLVGKQSLFMLSGEAHKKMRKILLPHFQKGQMKHFGKVIDQLLPKYISRFEQGKVFPFVICMRELIMEIMIHAIFGVIEPIRVAKYIELFMALDRHASGGMFYLNKFRPYLLGLGPWRNFEKLQLETCQLILEDIRERKKQSAGGQDILSRLLDLKDENGEYMLSDDELLDQLITLIFAGYETTSSGIAWAMNWILSHPNVLEKVHGELDLLPSDAEADAFASLPYLDAACCEAARISPVINLVVMEALVPLQIGAYDIKPGTNFGISITCAHRSEEVFPEPESYLPERFLERQFAMNEFFPFGGGARRCVGAALATFEIRTILGKLLRSQRFRLEKPEVSKPLLHGVVIAPKSGVPLIWDGPR